VGFSGYCLYKSTFNSKGAYTSENVAAIWPCIDGILTHDNLDKKKVNIYPGLLRTGYDSDFAGKWISAAQAVYLALTVPHGCKQEGIA
jgi:hypothetical protein